MEKVDALFRAGVKLVGVLAILWALLQIEPIIVGLYSVMNHQDMMPSNALAAYRFSMIFRILVPLVLFAIGVYLLKNQTALERKTENAETFSDSEQIFLLFMKLAGLVLLLIAIPTTFQIVADLLFASSVHIFGIQGQIEQVWGHAVSTVVEWVLGFYLLSGGKVFWQIAFSK